MTSARQKGDRIKSNHGSVMDTRSITTSKRYSSTANIFLMERVGAGSFFNLPSARQLDTTDPVG